MQCYLVKPLYIYKTTGEFMLYSVVPQFKLRLREHTVTVFVKDTATVECQLSVHVGTERCSDN